MFFEETDLDLLEQLCKIKLTKAEKSFFLSNLKKILTYIDQLEDLDTKDIPTCNHVLEKIHNNIFREDKIKQEFTKEDFLSNSPDNISGMIKVPSILKNV